MAFDLFAKLQRICRRELWFCLAQQTSSVQHRELNLDGGGYEVKIWALAILPCALTHLQTCVCMCRGQHLASDVFINCSPPPCDFSRQGLSLNWELVDYSGQQDLLDLPVSPVPELQMHTGVYTVSGFCCGCWRSKLRSSGLCGSVLPTEKSPAHGNALITIILRLLIQEAHFGNHRKQQLAVLSS